MSKFKHIVNKTKKMQFGGLISGLAGGLTGDLFGQGLPNNAYNYQDTGHRSTSYDGIQYIPQATQPNIMPQLLEAYNSKYKVKDFYDPKNKLDTGDFEKTLDMYQIDKDMWYMDKAKANKEIEEYILLNRRDESKMAMLPMFIEGIKDKLTKGTAGRIHTFKDNTDLVNQYNKEGLGGDDHQYFDGKNALYKREYIDEKGQPKTMLAFEDEIYNKFGNLKGWQTGGMTTYHKNAEYLTPETADRSKKMQGENTTFDKSKNMVDGYLKDAHKNTLKTAFANSGLEQSLAGYNSNTLIFKNSSGSQLTEDNYEQIESGVRSVTESLDPKIILGLKRNFNNNLNREATIIKRYDKETKVTEMVKDNNGNLVPTEVTKKRGDIMKDEKGNVITKVQNLSEVSKAEKETAFQMYAAGFIRDRANYYSGKAQLQEASSSVTGVNHNHGDGSGAANAREEERLKTNDLNDLENGAFMGGTTEAGGIFASWFNAAFGNDAKFSIKRPVEKSESTGVSVKEDELLQGAIEPNTSTQIDGSPAYIFKDGKKIEGRALESEIQRVGQNITDIYVNTGKKNKEGKPITKKVTTYEIAAVNTSSNLKDDITGLKGVQELKAGTPDYNRAVQDHINRKIQILGAEHATVKDLRDKAASGTLIVHSAPMRALSSNAQKRSSNGNQKQNNEQNTKDKFEKKGREEGGKLQEGGIISDDYFKKIELPNIKLEDLY